MQEKINRIIFIIGIIIKNLLGDEPKNSTRLENLKIKIYRNLQLIVTSHELITVIVSSSASSPH